VADPGTTVLLGLDSAPAAHAAVVQSRLGDRTLVRIDLGAHPAPLAPDALSASPASARPDAVSTGPDALSKGQTR
jgi:hypothetical protein